MANDLAAELARHDWGHEHRAEAAPESGKHRTVRATRGQPGETVARMLRILMMLPKPPHKITAREIFRRLRDEGLDVTTRTVERDLHRLRQVIPLVLDAEHKPYGWGWDRTVGSALVE